MLCRFPTKSFKQNPAVFAAIPKAILSIQFHSLVQPLQSSVVDDDPAQELVCVVHDDSTSVRRRLEDLACEIRESPCSEVAKLLHNHLYKFGFVSDCFLPNTLLHGYCRIGDLDSAHKLFEEMPMRNCVTWSVLLSGYTQNNLLYEALNLFIDIFGAGFVPNRFAIGSALRACQGLDSSSSLNIGKQIHSSLCKLGFGSDPTVCNVLISTYGNSSSPTYARQVFECMIITNLGSWNSLISVYSQTGSVSDCFALFSSMQQEAFEFCFRPNEYTLGSLISVSCSSIEHGMGLLQQILTRVQKSGFVHDLYVASALVNGFARFGLIDYAKQIFEGMREKNAISMNGLLVGLVSQGRGEEAAEIFRKEKDFLGTTCDSYVVLLSAFPEFKSPQEGRDKGREVHSYVIKTGLIDTKIAIGNGLINMYAKCGAITEACSVFRLMVSNDSVSWNSIISSLDQNNYFEEAIVSFISMRKTGLRPTNFTLISTLSAGATMGWVSLGEQVHCEGLKLGLDLDTSVSNALLGMYCETGCVSSCRNVFELMFSYDEISWNTIIGGCTLSKHSESEAVEYYLEMLQGGWVPNKITFLNILSAVPTPGDQIHASVLKHNFADDVAIENALISWYGKGGLMEDSEKIFSQMGKRKDEISWNAMISGYIHNEMYKAMELVRSMMQKGQKLDAFTFATLLSACASVATLQRGMEVHAFQIRACLESDIVIGSAIIDMYSKCGRIDYASRVFYSMPAKNFYSWNSMISGYARHGFGQEALQIFKRMKVEGPRPDHVSFVGVLSACSHAGLVEEGFQHFESMSGVYNLTPEMEHYSCMVDLLGRTGDLAKVEDFVAKMPMEPGVLVWRTVLGACCRWSGRKTNLGRRAAEMLMQLEPQNAVNYVLLSNMYASRDSWEDVAETRRRMRDSGGRKEIGCSWVTMKDGVHVFVSGDESHPEYGLIWEKLRELRMKMKDLGYVPQTKFALYDVDVESKELLLSHHSEKLAVAFVLTRKSEMTIRIMKNLRICGDCHVAFKYISRIAGREIVLRDSNRFHHFTDGQCSCGDYW